MAFHDIRFPTDIAFASTGGPERRTEIVTLASGHEERNSPWAQSRRRYDAGYGVKSMADLQDVIAFFEARHGRLHGFRWRDWSDYSSSSDLGPVSGTDQALGTGDGETTTFALLKRYTSGGQSYTRSLSHPVETSLRVAVDGVEQTSGFASVDGSVVFDTPPAPGLPISAGFEFDVPVRFDTDYLAINLASFEAGEIPSIPIVEIRT